MPCMPLPTRECMPTETIHELKEFNKQHIMITMTKINVIKNNSDSTMYNFTSCLLVQRRTVHSFEQTIRPNLSAGNLHII